MHMSVFGRAFSQNCCSPVLNTGDFLLPKDSKAKALARWNLFSLKHTADAAPTMAQTTEFVCFPGFMSHLCNAYFGNIYS